MIHFYVIFVSALLLSHLFGILVKTKGEFMKKIILILTFIMMISSMSSAVEVETSVTLNGHYIQGDENHLLINDRVYVVARTITDALNQDIEWLEETQQVKITDETSTLLLTIDDNTAYVNEEVYTFDASPFILNGRTYIPIRMVSELLGCQVNWVDSTFTVEITKEDFELDPQYIYERPYTDEDLLWLSRIVDVESDYNSIAMKLGIANVVLNRVNDPRFPNTVAEVIFDDTYATQFPPAHKSSFASLEPSILSILASKKALEGYNNIGSSLYFNNSPFRSRADDLFKIIDGEYFYE